MTVNDLREKIVFKNYKWTAPKYYDHPDGQDLLGKLSFTTKIGFFSGAVFGLFYTYKVGPKPTSNLSALVRSLTWLPPFVAAPFAFTTVTYTSTNMRGKDDQINYLFGSIAAAVVGATLARIPQHTVMVAVIFSTIGMAKKTAQMKGTILFPPCRKRVASPYFQRVMDFSLIKNGEPGWTKSLPPVEK